MAHSYVEAFPCERDAFLAFARDFPEAAVLLVDTYDTLHGVRTAIELASEVRGPLGVRLDSGDLAGLSKQTRELLDEAGLTGARIMASGGLDEHRLAEITAAGAPIDAFGIGTRMGVSADAPSLDSAYKLVEYEGRPVMKLSPEKLTAPGAKQVYRGGTGEADLLALREEPPPDGRRPCCGPR
ncbi:hypothetical protein ACFQ0O_10785 [Saccharopolyspora spinosporotrichia]